MNSDYILYIKFQNNIHILFLVCIMIYYCIILYRQDILKPSIVHGTGLVKMALSYMILKVCLLKLFLLCEGVLVTSMMIRRQMIYNP